MIIILGKDCKKNKKSPILSVLKLPNNFFDIETLTYKINAQPISDMTSDIKKGEYGMRSTCFNNKC